MGRPFSHQAGSLGKKEFGALPPGLSGFAASDRLFRGSRCLRGAVESWGLSFRHPAVAASSFALRLPLHAHKDDMSPKPESNT